MNKIYIFAVLLVVISMMTFSADDAFAQDGVSEAALAIETRMKMPLGDGSLGGEYDVSELVDVTGSDKYPLHARAMAARLLGLIGDGQAVPALVGLLDDPRLATYARTALETMGKPEADAALREALDRLEGDLLIGVIGSIGKRRDEAAIDRLVELAKDKDNQIAAAAARALGSIGTNETVEILALLMLMSTDDDRQVALANSLLIGAQRCKADGNLLHAMRVYDFLIDYDLPTHIKEAAILAKSGMPQLEKLLDSEDERQFRLGLQIAREMGDASNETLIKRFVHLTPSRRVKVILLFRDRAEPAMLPVLLCATQSESAEVRIRATAALGRFSDPRAAIALLKMSANTDAEIAQAARIALGELESDAVDAAIVGRLAGNDPSVVRSACDLAARRGVSAAEKSLIELARGRIDDSEVRSAATAAMGSTICAESLPVLIRISFESGPSELQTVANRAIESAVQRLPRESTVATLKSFYDSDTKIEEKVMLLQHMAAVGGPDALAVIVAAARSENDALQDTATRILGGWMTPDAAPALLELARVIRSEKYKIRALRGAIRIARQFDMPSADRLAVCQSVLELATREEEKALALEVLSRFGNETGFTPIFDGKTTDGWEGNMEWFRIEDGAVVAGKLTEPIPRNEFLCTKMEYEDFELRLQFKIIGERANAGIQIRSKRIPNHHEVSGYQADLGNNWWGCLYDESRRRKVLAGPPAPERAKPVRMGQWNDYRILCEGPRIRLWINDVLTVDFTEQEENIPRKGMIGLQVHSGAPMEAWYRNIRIRKIEK